MRTAARTDGNQAEIVAALRAVGASVQLLHRVGQGCPDILVGWRGVNLLVEIKMPGKRLNAREAKWHAEWRGQVAVAWDAQGAIDMLNDLSAP